MRKIAALLSAAAPRRQPRALAVAAGLLLAMILPGCKPSGQDASQIPHTPIPMADARLQVAHDGQQVRYEGLAADATTQARWKDALQAAYGTKAGGEIAINPDTHPAPWTNTLGEAFKAFNTAGARLEFQGKRIILGGTLPNEDRAELLKALRRLYPGYTLDGLFQGTDMRYALPDPGDEAGLLTFLNLTAIGFYPGSGMLTPPSLQALDRTARGINKAATPDMRLQVGVVAEGADTAEQARQVAAQRAEAVRLQLILRGVNPARLDAKALPADSGKPGAVVFSRAGTPPPAATPEETDAPSRTDEATVEQTAPDATPAPAPADSP